MRPAHLLAPTLLMLALPLTAAAFDWSKIDLNKAKDVIEKTGKATKPMSRDEEIALGKDVAAKLLGGAPPVNDKALQDYVNQVGMWLALHTDKADLPWRFAVLASDNVNAFTAPGGYVFITRGMLMRCRDESELAGILAHEIVHVTDRHVVNTLRRGSRFELGADLVGMYADQKVGKDRAQLVNKISDATAELYTRGLDKEDEYAADRKGAVIAARAGYDPYGLPSVLQTIASMNPQSDAVALMFKTHPDTGQRVELLLRAMEGRLDRYGDRPKLADRFAQVMRAHVASYQPTKP